MSDIVKPEILEAKYVDMMSCHWASPDGEVDAKWINLEHPFEVQIKQSPEIHPNLAIVDFYKIAVVRVRHPESLLPEEAIDETEWAGRSRFDILRAERGIKYASTQYVVSSDDKGPQFAEKQTILDGKQLTPYMKGWMGGFALGRYWPSGIDVF